MVWRALDPQARQEPADRGRPPRGSAPDSVRLSRDLLLVALVLGLTGGLLEGVIHIALQKLGFLENSWYQIIWISAAFNGALLGLLALLAAPILAASASRRIEVSVVFSLVAAAVLPWLSLLLKEWIEPYAVLLLLVGMAAAVTRWYGQHTMLAVRLSRRALPWVAGATLLTGIGIEGGFWLTERVSTARLPAASPTKPDILIVIVDALRADHLSSYGYGRPSSPTLDRLANEGVLFENAFSTSSYTLPSHASILTGLYPYQHGVEWQTSKQHTAAAYENLPQRLQTLGYRTGAFSANTFWFTREHGFGQGFLHFDDFFHSVPDRVMRTAYGRIATRLLQPLGWEDIPARRRATEISQSALEWISRATDRPFFAVLNYLDAHDPYLPPQPYRNRFTTVPNPGGLLNWDLHVPETLTPDALQSEIDAYDGGLAYVDAQIDALMSALRARNSDRELLVVITSDHGEEFHEHGGFLHGRHLYREVIHVPLIIWWPGGIPGHRRVTSPVTNASIPATILNLVGSDWHSFAAPPLQRLWMDPIEPPDWPAPLSEMRHRPWAERTAPVREGSLRSVVSKALHYIEHDSRPPQLYDWAADPLESKNLASQPDMQVVVERFGVSVAPARTPVTGR